ncbi:MAG: hypothetical protein D8M59_03895 [Planctomycetes bacterium]|nr:hypothetical protein [Planctomycetota bacterium]
MTIDDLQSEWLTPAEEEHFSLPAITNFRGMVQTAWGLTGIQNWICPPTGYPTPTALLYYEDPATGRIRRAPTSGIEYRWRAHEIERRCPELGIETAMRMPAERYGVMQRIRFVDQRITTAYLVFVGLPRVWRFTDYWNLPPEDVPQMNLRRIDEQSFLLDDTKTFGFAHVTVPGATSLAVYRNLHEFVEGQSSLPAGTRGRVGVVRLDVSSAQQEFGWHASQGCHWSDDGTAENRLPGAPDAEQAFDPVKEWDSGRAEWNRVWESAFEPSNDDFAGHLPAIDENAPLQRLYYMSVLTLLMTRRFIPEPTTRAEIATGGQCIWSEKREPLKKAYVWGGPDGAPTTSFLWELEFQSSLLARLDPVVLREQMNAMIRVDLHKHWGIETISGSGAGMGYGVNPGAFLYCAAEYVKHTGDRQWALDNLEYLRSCARPELTDYGDCQNVLECVSTYEHTIAAFNALAVSGLRFLAELTGEDDYAQQADRLAAEVIEQLWAGGPWYCIQPDGSKRVVKTILDFVYVGRHMTGDLPDEVKAGMLAFFEKELQTEDWLYALAPSDPDALTAALPTFQTYRADHQATGSYDGWPARAASVLLKFGEREKVIAWLERLEQLTHEGPFGQAHFIHDASSSLAPGECTGGHADGTGNRVNRMTRKASFFNGNCYFESAAVGFAVMMLDDLGMCESK